MAFNISYIIEARDQFTAQMSKMKQAVDGLTVRLEKASRASMRMSRRVVRMGSMMSRRISAPIAAFGAASLIAAGRNEKMQLQLEAMTGSASKASAVMKQLSDFSFKNALNVTEVDSAAKALLNAGIPVDQLQAKLSTIGDVAAGSGQKLEKVTSAFLDVMESGKITKSTITQIPGLLLQLQKMSGKSQKEVLKLIEKGGGVSSRVFDKAMSDMTHKGGMFYHGMEKGSQTFEGAIGRVKTSFIGFGVAIGEQINKTFNLNKNLGKLAEWLDRAAKNMQNFASAHPALMKILLWAGAILAVLGPIIMFFGTLGIAISATIIALKALAAVFLFALSPVGIIIGVIAAAILAIWANWDTIQPKLIAGFNTVVNFLEKVRAAIMNAFKMAFDYVSNLFTQIIDSIMAKFNAVLGFFGKVKGFFGLSDQPQMRLPESRPIPYPSVGVAAGAAAQKSELNATITIKDPGGNVANSEVKKSGPVIFNSLGTNMAGAY